MSIPSPPLDITNVLFSTISPATPALLPWKLFLCESRVAGDSWSIQWRSEEDEGADLPMVENQEGRRKGWQNGVITEASGISCTLRYLSCYIRTPAAAAQLSTLGLHRVFARTPTCLVERSSAARAKIFAATRQSVTSSGRPASCQCWQANQYCSITGGHGETKKTRSTWDTAAAEPRRPDLSNWCLAVYQPHQQRQRLNPAGVDQCRNIECSQQITDGNDHN